MLELYGYSIFDSDSDSEKLFSIDPSICLVGLYAILGAFSPFIIVLSLGLVGMVVLSRQQASDKDNWDDLVLDFKDNSWTKLISWAKRSFGNLLVKLGFGVSKIAALIMALTNPAYSYQYILSLLLHLDSLTL